MRVCACVCMCAVHMHLLYPPPHLSLLPFPTCRYSCYQNLVLDDTALAVSELADYKKAGGGTLVDCTTAGIRLDPAQLVEVSKNSGVKIVCGTGFYVDNFLDGDMKVGEMWVWGVGCGLTGWGKVGE